MAAADRVEAAKARIAAQRKAPAGKKPRDVKRTNEGWETVPVLNLVAMAAPYNPRKIDPHDLAALRLSLVKFGAVEPVVLNTRTESKGWPKAAPPVIVGGHQRIKAAEAEDMEEFPVFWVDLDRVEEKQLNLALNRISGSWDNEKLVDALRDIEEAGGDLALTGFDDDELMRLLQRAEEGETDPDAIPNDVEQRCEIGDLWILGEHRILCGDATDSDAQARLFGGEQPLLCITDPPYGVEYDPKWRNEAAEKGQLAYAARRVGEVDNDDRADWGPVFAASGCDVLYHWSAPGDLSIVAGGALMDAGYSIRNQIIWRKPHFPLSRGHYTYQHEPCWYAVRKGAKAHWVGDKKQSSVWEVSLDENVPGGHSTQKPVELFTRAITNHKGDVFEPFCGSGTCLIACEQLSRRCFAMEINPKYADVILARWEAFTGAKAERDGS